ncbi:hypothetical protein WN48_07843 [Eufriesea mexicana]|nr:hypothetical protein WN48_07843 [Eufriesea mexicana]
MDFILVERNKKLIEWHKKLVNLCIRNMKELSMKQKQSGITYRFKCDNGKRSLTAENSRIGADGK